MWWIIIGVLNLIAGMSGQFVLRGTNSSGALIAAAIVMILVGIFQLIGKSRKTANQETVAPAESDNKDQY